MTTTDDRAIQRIARKMASSGQFPDFESIELTMSRVIGEAVQRIGSRGFRRQINRLCAMAQSRLVFAESVGHERSGDDDGYPGGKGGDCSHSLA